MIARILFVAAIVLFAANVGDAQTNAPPWTACMTAYESGAYDAAATVCTNAQRFILADEKRARRILVNPPPYAPATQAFLFDRGVKALQVHLYSALVARKRGDDAGAQRQIHEAAIWGLNLSFVLQRMGPKGLSNADKTYGGVVGAFLQQIDRFQPGILQREVNGS